MHKRSLKDDLQRSKRSLKIRRLYEDEVIKLKTLKTRRMVRDSFISSILDRYLRSLEIERLRDAFAIVRQVGWGSNVVTVVSKQVTVSGDRSGIFSSVEVAAWKRAATLVESDGRFSQKFSI
ncbi:hypothetical protein M9H77_03917 [Catharanthus roseus]|uniref:Uncharacterized protein n=1 Tax=Catharanthus roseus TaxID=4058 RepID=A0ACC0CCS9_CATRO|nr:hypothetical protein M9H77_03917 [Catharanthus roseus]